MSDHPNEKDNIVIDQSCSLEGMCVKDEESDVE